MSVDPGKRNCPPAPPSQAPYFDPASETWILSRYQDVQTAFREPNLWPARGGEADRSSARDETGRLLTRGAVLDALSAAHLAKWQPHVEEVAIRIAERLSADRPVDLLSEFAMPFGVEAAMLATQSDPAIKGSLSALGDRVFAATGAPEDSPVQQSAALATAELERIFENGPVPMGEPTFIALSQTTPRLLASMWLALINDPGQFALLRAQPSLMPGAIEELLRYAGIVRRVYRCATGTVNLSGSIIEKGQRVALMLASANRDPAEFADPDRLDITRRFTRHVALGMGRNSCVGAVLVRMASAVATTTLAGQFSTIELSEIGEWRIGSGFCFPGSVYTMLRRTNSL